MTPSTSVQPAVPCPPPGGFPARHASLTSLALDGTVRFRAALPGPDDDTGFVAPVSDGSSVWALTGQQLRRYDASGRRLWSTSAPGEAYGLWLRDGVLVALVDQVSSHAYLLGVDPSTGAVRWRFDSPRPRILGDPALTGDGALVWVDVRGPLSALDLRTGRLRWSVPGTPNTVGFAVAPGLVLRGVGGYLHAYDTRTGAQRWVSEDIHSDGWAPSVVGDVVVDGGFQVGAISALSLSTGRTVWRYASGPRLSVVGTGPSGVLLDTSSGKRQLTMLDPQGRPRFVVEAYSTYSDLGGPLVGADSIIGFEGGTGEHLVRRDLTGRIVWRVSTGHGSNDDLQPLGTSLLVASDGPRVTAWDRATGRRVWSRALPQYSQRLSTSAGGVVLQSQEPGYGCAF